MFVAGGAVNGGGESDDGALHRRWGSASAEALAAANEDLTALTAEAAAAHGRDGAATLLAADDRALYAVPMAKLM